ncbi:hypothetical protein AB9K34_20910 [Sedimentitalea sp. XS_ASV28]|uniref:hypothetical protein n=1 Tax=Sedimentitalea sp. XS_ASV28 TaxID=3241296 RepID=UPI0035161E14
MPDKSGFCIRHLTHIQKTDVHAADSEGKNGAHGGHFGVMPRAHAAANILHKHEMV